MEQRANVHYCRSTAISRLQPSPRPQQLFFGGGEGRALLGAHAMLPSGTFGRRNRTLHCPQPCDPTRPGDPLVRRLCFDAACESTSPAIRRHLRVYAPCKSTVHTCTFPCGRPLPPTPTFTYPTQCSAARSQTVHTAAMDALFLEAHGVGSLECLG